MACVLRFCPPFSIFLAYVTTHAPQFPHHLHLPTLPKHMPHHVPSNHRAYSCLSYTHMHYPPCLGLPLVLIGCAETHYHLPMTHSPLTDSPPSDTIQFPHLVYFLIPVMLLIACISDHVSLISHFLMTHLFHPHHVSLISHFSDPALYLASFHLHTQIQTQTHICI